MTLEVDEDACCFFLLSGIQFVSKPLIGQEIGVQPHTRIAEHSLASTTSPSQNFHTYVTFNAEFDGVVQIFYFLCANIIKF